MENNELIDKEIFKFLHTNKPNAVANVSGSDQFPQIAGLVEFYNLPIGVLVVADIDNLPKTETNIFAFHIHEGSSCENNFEDTGGHYNPTNLPHPNHAGDLPPLFSNDGFAWQAVFTNRFKLSEILNKTIVIHNQPDDFTSQPAGNSGQKIACGVIRPVVTKTSFFRRK